MLALDFEYNKKRLSDYGFTICNFNNKSGTETETGQQIIFNTLPIYSGRKNAITSTKYNSCIESTFQICKKPDYDNLIISDMEYRKIARWLNQKRYYKMRFLDADDLSDIYYFNASFNLSKITINGLIYGIELHMVTDSPFAYGVEEYKIWNDTIPNYSYKIVDGSDEIGDTYINIIIKCKEAGDLEIKNQSTNQTLKIKNCLANEEIFIDGENQIITSDNKNHKIYNDFNYEFLKISNSENSTLNKITFSIRCDVKIKYTPIYKFIP